MLTKGNYFQKLWNFYPLTSRKEKKYEEECRKTYTQLVEKLGRKGIGENIFLKLRKVPDANSDIRGKIEAKKDKYTIFIDPTSEKEESILPRIFHEIGEVLLRQYWIGYSEQEKIVKELEKNESKVLKAGESLARESAISAINKRNSDKFVDTLINEIKKGKREISPKKFATYVRKAYGGTLPTKKLREMYTIGRYYVENEKVDIGNLIRDLSMDGGIDCYMKDVLPPYELLAEERKLDSFITFAENKISEISDKLKEFERSEAKEMKKFYEDKLHNLNDWLEILKNYRTTLNKHYNLRIYREGFCEFIMDVLCKEKNVPQPQQEYIPVDTLTPDIMHEIPYQTGLQIFRKLSEGIEPYELINRALDHSDFKELASSLSIDPEGFISSLYDS